MLNYTEGMLWWHNIFLHKILVGCSHCPYQSYKGKQVEEIKKKEKQSVGLQSMGQGTATQMCSTLSALS